MSQKKTCTEKNKVKLEKNILHHKKIDAFHFTCVLVVLFELLEVGDVVARNDLEDQVVDARVLGGVFQQHLFVEDVAAGVGEVGGGGLCGALGRERAGLAVSVEAEGLVGQGRVGE